MDANCLREKFPEFDRQLDVHYTFEVRNVYIETTVVSYFTARPSRDVVVAARQESTRELWPRLLGEYDSYISVLVREEASKGDDEQAALRIQAITEFTTLDTDATASALALKIVEGHGIPAEYPEDALHIAVAAVKAWIFWSLGILPTSTIQLHA